MALAGAIDRLEQHLIREGATVRKVEHPLDSYHDRDTIVSTGGSANRRYRRRQLSGPLNLLIDVALTAHVALSDDSPIIIAANNFDTVTCGLVRALRRNRPFLLIYFGSDFSENRFDSRVMNLVYRTFEHLALRLADTVVSNTRRAERARLGLGLSAPKSVFIPNGVDLGQRELRPKSLNRRRFIYVGSVTEEHGLLPMVEALSPMIDELIILGDGAALHLVLRRCAELGLVVRLRRAIPHDEVLDSLVAFDGFGLAPYNASSQWTYYCSPMKVVEYVACGVPVIISDVPEIAAEVAANALGIVYGDLDPVALCDRVVNFDTSSFYESARSCYLRYKTSTLFGPIAEVWSRKCDSSPRLSRSP